MSYTSAAAANIKTTESENNLVTKSSTNKYVVLMETSGEEMESWYYFIKYNGNEKNLEHLQQQLQTVDWHILEEMSTFDLDLDHLVSETTAKEMIKLDLNHHSFHRKFDGILDPIDLKLRHRDKNDKKIVKIFDILGYGQIENFIDNEDIEEEEEGNKERDTDKEDVSRSASPVSYNSRSEKSDDDDEDQDKKSIPKSLMTTNLPKFTKNRHTNKNN
jgi:hypothetical protein